jgi:hypothetical protein
MDGNPPEVEQLLAAERELVPESDRVRDAAVARARAALPRGSSAHRVMRAHTPSRGRVALCVAAAVLLFAVCAAALVAGYRSKPEGAPQTAAPQSLPPHSVGTLAPSSPMAPPSVTPEPPLREPQTLKARSGVAKKSASLSEAEWIELQVLRPAQQAAWRGDFASTLAAVAEHQRRFPSGRLAEEREALRVKALLGLGRIGEAQSAGAAFRRRFPQSALLERINAMLEKQK